MLKSDNGSYADHFRTQHKHTEDWDQREHAYDFTVRLEACKNKFKKKNYDQDTDGLCCFTINRIKTI